MIANHNYGKWLPRAINSALNQTYKDLEVCVIDDGSTDNSQEILDEYSNAPCFESEVDIQIIFRKKSGGPSSARNDGIRATKDRADFWVVLDADDEMLPTKVEKFAKVLEDKNYGFVYADYENFSEDGPTIREYKEPYSKLRLMQECIVHSGGGFSKEAVLKANVDIDFVYNERLRCAEDWDLWLKLSRTTLGYHIPEVLTKVLIHNQNATNSVNQETWQKCWQYIGDNLRNGTYN